VTALQVIQGGRADGGEQTRLPPTDLEAEALVVGTLLWGKAAAALEIFRQVIGPEHFFSPELRTVFAAALAVAEQHGADAVDLATVISKLTEQGKLGAVTNGRDGLDELRRNTALVSSKRQREWAISVHDAWRRRQAIAIAQVVEAKGYLGVESTQEYVEHATRRLLWLANTGHGRAEESKADQLSRLLKAIEERRAARARNEVVVGMGVPFGLESLDRVLRGMRPGKKITIVARPGLGKSALAMQAVAHAAECGVGGVYYAAEPGMSLDDHMLRLLAATSKIDCQRIEQGALLSRETDRLIAASEEISKLPLEIVDARTWDADRIVSDAKRRSSIFRTIHRADLGVIVVDHIHALAPTERLAREKKFAVVSYGTERMAALASEIGACVVELAQEKRGEKPRNGKEAAPTKADVSDSSEIEKSTTSMVFLRELGDRDIDGVQKMRCYVVKNRDGVNNTDFDLEFITSELRFLEAYRP